MESLNTSAPVTSGYRKRLQYAVGLSLAILIAASLYPFAAALLPPPHLKDQAFTDVNIANLEPGEAVVTKWNHVPVVILHRTPQQLAEIKSLKAHRQYLKPDTVAPDPGGLLPDLRSIRQEYFVAYKWSGQKKQCSAQYIPPDSLDSYSALSHPYTFFEGCRGAWYDSAGHVFQIGWPMSKDLSIPPHRYISDTVIRLGPPPIPPTFPSR